MTCFFRKHQTADLHTSYVLATIFDPIGCTISRDNSPAWRRVHAAVFCSAWPRLYDHSSSRRTFEQVKLLATATGPRKLTQLILPALRHHDLQKLPDKHALAATATTGRDMDRIIILAPTAHCSEPVQELQ
jgi:hypothetical protein